MRPEILSLIGGFPFLPGPLDQSSTVITFDHIDYIDLILIEFIDQ